MSTPLLELDHLVVATNNLETACAELEARWGVRFSGGGQHLGYGTHNRVIKIDWVADLDLNGELVDSRQVYLELIAIDPTQPKPAVPRLFDLDNPAMQAQLAQGPKLIHFVTRTASLTDALATCGYNPGKAVAMQRGELQWQITMPSDGKPSHGILPTLITWPNMDRHPAKSLPHSGLQLMFFGVAAPAEPLEILKRSGLQFVPALNPSTMLHAELKTPNGVFVL